jgi:hypothetical protein
LATTKESIDLSLLTLRAPVRAHQWLVFPTTCDGYRGGHRLVPVVSSAPHHSGFEDASGPITSHSHHVPAPSCVTPAPRAVLCLIQKDPATARILAGLQKWRVLTGKEENCRKRDPCLRELRALTAGPHRTPSQSLVWAEFVDERHASHCGVDPVQCSAWYGYTALIRLNERPNRGSQLAQPRDICRRRSGR